MSAFKKITAFLTAVGIACTCAACGYNTINALTVDGHEVPAGVYIYYANSAYNQALSKLQEENPDIDTTDTNAVKDSTLENKLFLDWVQDEATKQCAEYVVIEEKFDELGLELDYEAKSNIEMMMSYYWDSSKDMMEKNGISEASFEKIVTSSYKSDMIFEHYYAVGGENGVTDDDVYNYYKDNNIRCEYIAMPLKDGDGNLLKSEGKQDMMKLAESYQKRADKALKKGGVEAVMTEVAYIREDFAYYQTSVSEEAAGITGEEAATTTPRTTATTTVTTAAGEETTVKTTAEAGESDETTTKTKKTTSEEENSDETTTKTKKTTSEEENSDETTTKTKKTTSEAETTVTEEGTVKPANAKETAAEETVETTEVSDEAEETVAETTAAAETDAEDKETTTATVAETADGETTETAATSEGETTVETVEETDADADSDAEDADDASAEETIPEELLDTLGEEETTTTVPFANESIISVIHEEDYDDPEDISYNPSENTYKKLLEIQPADYGKVFIVEEDETYYLVVRYDLEDRMNEDDLWTENTQDSTVYTMFNKEFTDLLDSWTESASVVRNEAAYKRYNPFKFDFT